MATAYLHYYLKNRDDNWAKDGKSMHTLQSIPHGVSLLKSHPTRRHEKIEDKVHDEQQYDQIEDLHREMRYDSDGEVVLATDDVEVCEDDEDEVIVRLYETRPRGHVLPRPTGTNMANMSISMRWVCLASVDS